MNRSIIAGVFVVTMALAAVLLLFLPDRPVVRSTVVFESSPQIRSRVRPSIADDGFVVAVAQVERSGQTDDRFWVGDGRRTTVVPSAAGTRIDDSVVSRVFLRSEAEPGQRVVVYSASQSCAAGAQLGVYELTVAGAPGAGDPVVLAEDPCPRDVGPWVDSFIHASTRGAVALSVSNTVGSLRVRPVGGAVGDLYPCPCRPLTTASELAINDSNQTLAYIEQGSLRNLYFFDAPADGFDHVLVAQFPNPAISTSIDLGNDGTIIFSANFDFTSEVEGTERTFGPGVYLAAIGPAGVELTSVATDRGDFCHFGHVTINDREQFAFEAQLDSSIESRCSSDSSMDGLFYGADPVRNRLVGRGEIALGDHADYDRLLLGNINNGWGLTYLTTKTVPGEPNASVIVWKADVTPPWILRVRNMIEQYLTRIERWFRPPRVPPVPLERPGEPGADPGPPIPDPRDPTP